MRINTENGEVEFINEPTSGVFHRQGSYSVSNDNKAVSTNQVAPPSNVNKVTSAQSQPSKCTYVMTSFKNEVPKKEPKSLVDAIQMQCSAEVLKSFINDTDDCNALWMQQARPLHLAVRTKQLSHIETLISSGADVNAQDTNGNTPLMVACKYATFDVMKSLLDAGAKVDMKNKQGESAIHLAVVGNCPKCIDLIIKHGASINSQDAKGLCTKFNNLEEVDL